MITRIKSNRIIKKSEIVSGYVYIEDDKILCVTGENLPFNEEFDAGDSFVSPGFIDIHIHGGAGYDFADGKESVINAANFHLTHGTTTICPTISAASFDSMAQSCIGIYEASKDSRAKSNILGAHPEGPYISKDQSGAQGAHHITPPKKEDYESFVKNNPGAISRWTYAPENDENGEFCSYIASHGILPSAGHTNAKYRHIKEAMVHGCKLITHLYSCTSTVTREKGFRNLGVVEAAYLEDDLYAEIIADGKHLPADLIKLILKIKGTDKTILVTDCLPITGTDVKRGKMVDTEFIIEDGVCKLLDRSAFAGSIATADRLIRVVTKDVNVPLFEAVKMLTYNPALIMGLNKGELAPGKDADIIIFDDDINVSHAWVMGKRV